MDREATRLSLESVTTWQQTNIATMLPCESTAAMAQV
jgi:hypothetical protein